MLRGRGLLLCRDVPPAVAYLGEGGLGSGGLGSKSLTSGTDATLTEPLGKCVSVRTTPEYAHEPATQQFPSWVRPQKKRARTGTTRNTRECGQQHYQQPLRESSSSTDATVD